MNPSTEYLEENHRPSRLLQRIITPIRQISSPIREISSPILQVSSQSIQKISPQSIQNVINKTRTPTSKASTRTSISNVDFEDPDSVEELASRLSSKRRKDPINIGKQRGDKTYFYSIHFGTGFFPIDFSPDSTRLSTPLTHIKCSSPSLPKIFLQVGRLRYTLFSNPDLGDRYEPDCDPIKSADTYFVIGVSITDRMAWALWNPDQFDAIDGTLPGFHKACTAIPLNQTIDELLTNSSTHILDLNPEDFLTLPRGSSVTYGGIDEEGWTFLSEMSPKYKRASKVHTYYRTV